MHSREQAEPENSAAELRSDLEAPNWQTFLDVLLDALYPYIPPTSVMLSTTA